MATPPEDGLRITASLLIPEAELTWRFSASGGPGGQHANTSNTRAEVVWDIDGSPSLNDTQRERLLARIGPEIRITADDERSQLRNRNLARQRLAQRIREGLHVPRSRRATKPSRGSVERRLQAKGQRSQLKAQRRDRPGGD